MGRRQTDPSDVSGHPKVAAQPPVKKDGKGVLSPVLRISLILGIFVHLLGFLFFRVVSQPLPERPDREGFVQFVSPARLGSSEALEEQAELMDTAPLFIPGQWNAAHNLRAPARDRVLQRFPYYQPEIDLLAQLRPERTPIGESFYVAAPSDLLALRYWDLFQGFGERSLDVPELESTGSFAEISDVRGSTVRTIPAAFEWRSTDQPNPVSFMLRVEAGGRTVAPPVLESSSSNEDFVSAAYRWLNNSRNTAGLNAGLYRIRIYP